MILVKFHQRRGDRDRLDKLVTQIILVQGEEETMGGNRVLIGGLVRFMPILSISIPMLQRFG